MELYEGLAADGVDFEFARAGVLIAFRDRATAAVGGSVWREVDGDEVYELEPMLRPGFSCGFFVESDCHVRPEAAALPG